MYVCVSTEERWRKGREITRHQESLIDVHCPGAVALRMMERFGLEVVVANNGEEAIRKLHENWPVQLILMDLEVCFPFSALYLPSFFPSLLSSLSSFLSSFSSFFFWL